MKKMKKAIYLLTLTGLFLGACDKIEEPYLEPVGGSGENKITVTVDIMDDLTGNFDLNVFIIEDKFVSPQKNDLASIGPTPDWLDYEHNHLLRASLTSNWGFDLVDNPANGSTASLDFSFDIEEDWVVENLSVLAFITDGGTFEILQAAEQGFTKSVVKQSSKVVLLEEFTGHLCVNCPEATKLSHDLKQTYGEQLLLLAIHAGDLAEPSGSPYENDLRTTAGTTIYNHFAPVGVPTGMVNRTEFGGGVVLFKDSWEPAIQALTEQPQQASISIDIELAE
ncbi:MAG: Omp28-related outer membrane protein [Bacteroidota bacterium]